MLVTHRFLNVIRGERRLEKVGAAMLPRQGLEYYAPRVPGESLTKYGFVSYLKDMVVAPEPVLAYMCQNVSVFFALFLSSYKTRWGTSIVFNL